MWTITNDNGETLVDCDEGDVALNIAPRIARNISQPVMIIDDEGWGKYIVTPSGAVEEL